MRELRLLLAGILAASAPALATSLRATTVSERARQSDRVVRVEVVSTETRLPDSGDVRRMMTYTTLRVLESYKGGGPETIELVQLGGRHGLWEARVPGDPTFEPKEHAVVFLRCRDAGNPGRCTLYGFQTGKLKQVGADEVLEETPAAQVAKRRLSAVVQEIRRASEGAR